MIISDTVKEKYYRYYENGIDHPLLPTRGHFVDKSHIEYIHNGYKYILHTYEVIQYDYANTPSVYQHIVSKSFPAKKQKEIELPQSALDFLEDIKGKKDE